MYPNLVKSYQQHDIQTCLKTQPTWLRWFWSQNNIRQTDYICFITFTSGNDANSDNDEPIDSNAQNDYNFKSEKDEHNEKSGEEEDDNEGSASSGYLTEDSEDDVEAGTNTVLALITK